MHFAKNVTSMWDTHKERLTWNTDKIMINVVSRPTSREEYELNLVETLDQVRRPKLKLEINDCHWLPAKEFGENNEEFRKTTLIPY